MTLEPKTSRRKDLEAFFTTYPDVPREIILKEDLLNGGQWFSDAALQVAERSLVKSYRLFSYDLIPMARMERKEFAKVPEWFTIAGGDYGLRPVNVQTTLAPDSPYLIDLIDGRLALRVDGAPICDVYFPKPLHYDDKTFEDGTRYWEIVAWGYFITVFRYCQYWGPEEECRFCDINENARQMKASKEFTLNVPMKPVQQVAEAVNAVCAEAEQRAGYSPQVAFLLTGGTVTSQLRGKNEDDFYLDYVEAVKWGGSRRHVTLQTNAKDKATMRRYRAAGLDSHHANMEVWDRRLFEWINPGKAKRVGWENWVRWTCESVEVFGEGNVRPNFVCGLEMAKPYGFGTVEEAVKSTTEGIDYMMRHGVVPRFNHWRREPGSYLVKQYAQPPVPLELYIQLARNRYELWKKYELPLPDRSFAHPIRRVAAVDHGTYDDYVFLSELPEYRERVMKVLEAEGIRGLE
jgi:hypothetical protein